MAFGEPLEDYARPHTLRRSEYASAIIRGLWRLVGIVFVGATVYGIYYFLFLSDQERLSSKYSVPVERVTVQLKPHGCAYNDAPLGEKHCHYDKHITVYDRNQQTIEIDGQPQTCIGCGSAYDVVEVFSKVEE